MRVDFVPGASYDLVSSNEMAGFVNGINQKYEQFLRQEYAGLKPFRFQSNVTPEAAAAFMLPMNIAPKSGYIWSILRLTVACTAGAGTPLVFRTQEVANITPNTGAALPDVSGMKGLVAAFPSINGHLTFGKGALLLQAGEILALSNNTSTAGASWIFSGEGVEVPAEMVGKLF